MTTGVKCEDTDVCVIRFVTTVGVVGYASVQIVDVKQSSVVLMVCQHRPSTLQG